MAQTRKIVEIPGNDEAAFSADIFSTDDCQADSAGDLTERTIRSGRTGEGIEARQEGRSTPADSQRLHVSDAVSNSPAGTIYHSSGICYGACRRALHQIFSAGTCGSICTGNAAC